MVAQETKSRMAHSCAGNCEGGRLAGTDAGGAGDLVQAASKIPPGSPAYESVAYYAIRLAKRAGHREEARRFADRALNHELLHSSRNWILAERFDLARDWNEFLRFSLRRPEPNVVEYDGSEEHTSN